MFGIKQPGILLDAWEKNKTWKVLGGTSKTNNKTPLTEIVPPA